MVVISVECITYAIHLDFHVVLPCIMSVYMWQESGVYNQKYTQFYLYEAGVRCV